MAQMIETAPLLSRLSRTGLLRDVLAGTALLASLLLLWGWFLLAVAAPHAPRAMERTAAVVERAARVG